MMMVVMMETRVAVRAGPTGQCHVPATIDLNIHGIGS